MNTLTKEYKAFTLAEILATLVISTIIMITALGVYGSVKRTAASIDKRLQRYGLPTEILQRIAEDIDRMLVIQTDTKTIFNNKRAEGNYSTGMLTIENTIYDTKNKPQVFEKIVWQSHRDPDADGLILYRSHSGYAMEDRVLDEPKVKYDRELFIPIASGLTHFSVQALVEDKLFDKWSVGTTITAFVVTLSFDEPVQNIQGQYEVPEEKLIKRTIAIDRTRQITYKFVKQEFILPTDVNSESNDIEFKPNNKKDRDRLIRNVPKR